MHGDQITKILTLGIEFGPVAILVFTLLFLLSFEEHLFYHVKMERVKSIVESITSSLAFSWEYYYFQFFM